MRRTELLTPLTLGRKDSATIATRTPSQWQRQLSMRLPTGIQDTKSCCLSPFRGRKIRRVVTIHPFVQQRKTDQGEGRTQPARDRDGTRRDDRQSRVAVLNP